MWPFKRKKQTDLKAQVQRDVEEAVAMVTQKWLIYRQLTFKEDVPLSYQIELFMEPALEGIIAAKPSIALCPTEMVLLIFLNGIADSGTHTALEVQDALGIPRG